MLLKKQTVWLLTMLSLIIVLSVYYITSPGSSDDLAYLEAGKKSGKDATVSGVASDDMFTALRLERDELRDEMESDYVAVAGSEDASAEVAAEAWEKLSELQSLSMKEQTVETLIKAKGFKDALVNSVDDHAVKVIVKADKLSKKDVVQIMNLANEHLGANKTVAVEFQAAK
ncbi:SpoIIIAH-like family protein [Fictibacillus barbaricus]|uniref:Stage III sporulation protein AH n=1 Tax=Fictibacillus barbaricus TaxID=182136 RepID=A0ABU1TZN4_9BACL|nr:SpoIIIAH-like family protein [Fictibacillus barbaricus]MDR7072686.1 stage III sporulation protein AH [Fictibacillus barbaricus]